MLSGNVFNALSVVLHPVHLIGAASSLSVRLVHAVWAWTAHHLGDIHADLAFVLLFSSVAVFFMQVLKHVLSAYCLFDVCGELHSCCSVITQAASSGLLGATMLSLGSQCTVCEPRLSIVAPKRSCL